MEGGHELPPMGHDFTLIVLYYTNSTKTDIGLARTHLDEFKNII